MVNTGLVGLGYWGPNLLRNLVANRRAGKVIICDKDPGRLSRIGERFPACERTQSFRDILSSPDVQAVLIATDVSGHYPLAMESLEAGKHIFVEKPFADTSDKAREMVERAESLGLLSMVGHTFLYSPPVIAIKSILDRGELGDIHFITSNRVNLGLHQKDVSVVWDLAPHDFSMIFHWLGEEPSHVEAFGSGYVIDGIPDVAFINLRFPCGAIANVQVSWLAPSKLRKTVIVGSRKMLVYDDTEPYEKVKIFDKGVELIEPETFGEYQLAYRTGDIHSPKLDSFEPLAAEIEEFLRCIETGGIPKTSGKSGLGVVRALELADASLGSGG